MRKTIACLVTVSMGLGGCISGAPCENRTDYKGVPQSNMIRIPEEMGELPPEERLDIPVAATPPDAPTECLERPPRFQAEEADVDP